MTKTQQIAFRFTPETCDQIVELARLWSGLTVPSQAVVVAECVRIVHETETKKRKLPQAGLAPNR